MSKGVATGGIGEKKEVNDLVHEICQMVRKEVEENAGKKYAEFTPIVFKTQLVNGTNYFIKVKVSDEKYIHIRAHRTFSGDKTSFTDFEDNKSLEEEITYFR